MIATTDGLILATTEIKSGNGEAGSSSGDNGVSGGSVDGDVQSGLVGAVTGGAGGVDGCWGSRVGSAQPKEATAPSSSDNIRRRETNRYFIFTFFTVSIISCG